MIQSRVLEVSKFLKSCGIDIKPSNEWLKSCVQCILQEASSLDNQSLNSAVQEQWLLADLREVQSPSLPSNCITDDKTCLNGKYAIQINYVVNISESFHKQLTRIRRPEAEDNLDVDIEKDNNQEIVHSGRNLKFELTDGLTTVVGFEDELIRSIVEPVVPGVKALLVGPVVCRKGIIFLREGSIKLLGGEVDVLLVANAVENVLARALGQPETVNPFKQIANDVQNEEGGDLMEDGNDDAFLQIPEEIESLKDNKNDNSRSNDSSCVLISPKYSLVTIDDDEDDDDFALIAAQTASLAEERVTKKEVHSSTPASDPSVKRKQSNLSNYFFKEAQSGNISSKDNQRPHSRVIVDTFRSKPASACDKNASRDLSGNLQEIEVTNVRPSRIFNMELPRSTAHEDKIIVDVTKDTPLTDMEVDSPEKSDSKSTEKQFPAGSSSRIPDKVVPTAPSISSRLANKSKEPSKKPPEPFPPTSFPAERVVFIEVIKTEKLNMRDCKWNLSARIKAQEIEMEVDFAPEVLDHIMEVKGEELAAMKKNIVNNSEERENVNKLLRERQRRVKKLSCPARLYFPSYSFKKAIITEVYLQ